MESVTTATLSLLNHCRRSAAVKLNIYRTDFNGAGYMSSVETSAELMWLA